LSNTQHSPHQHSGKTSHANSPFSLNHRTPAPQTQALTKLSTFAATPAT
jgi:hypothetical protein